MEGGEGVKLQILGGGLIARRWRRDSQLWVKLLTPFSIWWAEQF